VVLLGAMSVKAYLIGTEFMDLKHEQLAVGVSIAFSVIFLGGVLYFLILPDGFAVLAGGR